MFAPLLLLAAQAGTVETFQINGVTREALVMRPARRAGSPPIVFAFHGHGGNMRFTARMGLEKLWPEALVVYPQGLPTKGMTDPEGKKNGWQQKSGDEGDRDLAFFDTMYAYFRKTEGFDPKRVYAMGHSNGGRMTYLLWKDRPDVLTAIAPSASPGFLALRNARKIPVFAVAGEKDSIVPFKVQEMTINGIRRRLGTDPSRAKKDGYTTLEPGPDGLELGTYIFPGEHTLPPEAIQQIVAFFKRH